MAKFLKEKQRIILERKGPNDYTFKSHGNMTAAEMADALLGAFCKVAKFLIEQGQMNPKVLREVTIKYLDELLGGE